MFNNCFKKYLFTIVSLFLIIISCGCSLEIFDIIKLPSRQLLLTETKEDFLQKLNPQDAGLSSWQELRPTLQKSISYVKAKKQKVFAIKNNHLSLTWGQLLDTLLELQRFLPLLDKNKSLLTDRFAWVPIEQGMFFTGYYEPLIQASRKAKKGYHPIYKRPPELSSYRRKKRKYHSRFAIDKKLVLAGRGLELAWAKSMVDVYFLQIQGSGKLQFEDGSTRYVNYNGQNGHKYVVSGKIMKERGLVVKGDVIEQRRWFANNPDKTFDILKENPSYVFFKWGRDGARGAMGRVVDPMLSLATDRKFIPLGAIVAYGVNMPDFLFSSRPMRAIAFTQDVGGAIRGNKFDIFMGSGPVAEYRASRLQNYGLTWVLVSKNIIMTQQKALLKRKKSFELRKKLGKSTT